MQPFFSLLDSPCHKTEHKSVYSRKFSPENLDRFKTLLRGTNWINVMEANNVDIAFEAFWAEFKQLYDLCFPLTRTKFNRNIRKINGYMTAGLLISRITKNMLHKTALCYPLPVNVEKYKTYRNLYNTVLRKSKTKYFDLNENVKNPKKTWEILKEATVGAKSNSKIEKITVDGKQISDPSCIADEFNKFFTSIGNSISNSVRPTATDPISLMPDNPNVANLNFEQFGPSHLCDVVKSFETKNSCDLDGISTKLLKHIIIEIPHPLSHIFNLKVPKHEIFLTELIILSYPIWTGDLGTKAKN